MIEQIEFEREFATDHLDELDNCLLNADLTATERQRLESLRSTLLDLRRRFDELWWRAIAERN